MIVVSAKSRDDEDLIHVVEFEIMNLVIIDGEQYFVDTMEKSPTSVTLSFRRHL